MEETLSFISTASWSLYLHCLIVVTTPGGWEVGEGNATKASHMKQPQRAILPPVLQLRNGRVRIKI